MLDIKKNKMCYFRQYCQNNPGRLKFQQSPEGSEVAGDVESREGAFQCQEQRMENVDMYQELKEMQ